MRIISRIILKSSLILVSLCIIIFVCSRHFQHRYSKTYNNAKLIILELYLPRHRNGQTAGSTVTARHNAPGRAFRASAAAWPTPAALAQFAERNPAPYRRHYERLLCRHPPRYCGPAATRLPLVPSWNWAAFLATVPWLFYRKMYSGGIILVAMPVFLDHILPGALFLGSGLLVAVVAGLCGKSWYIEHAVRRIAKARRSHPSPPGRAAYLARARGVSPSAGIFGALIQAVTAIVIVMDLVPPSRF